MNRRRSNKQPDLFPDGVAQIGHNGAPGPRNRESRKIYEAVLYLRIYAAKSVYRVGREHLVAGRQVSTAQLGQICRAECRRICGSVEFPDYALHRLGMGPRPADYPAP